MLSRFISTIPTLQHGKRVFKPWPEEINDLNSRISKLESGAWKQINIPVIIGTVISSFTAGYMLRGTGK